MDSEKREFRVGHGIDVGMHKIATFRLQDVVVATKRHDSRIFGGPGELCDSIRIEARAGDEGARFKVTEIG